MLIIQCELRWVGSLLNSYRLPSRVTDALPRQPFTVANPFIGTEVSLRVTRSFLTCLVRSK